MARVRREFDIVLLEYNSAHGFTPVANPLSRIDEVRARGRDLNAEIARDGRAKSSRTASHVSADRPKYSTPGKNLRAAEAAAAELPNLSGDARSRQQDRVNELVAIANRQNEAFRNANPDIGGSRYIHSNGGAGAVSRGQASSPYVGRSRDRSVNSGKNKQLQAYDPVYAGKQIAGQGHAGQGAPGPVQVRQGVDRVNPANPGQPPRYPVPNPPRQRQGAGYAEQAADRYNDDYPAMERAGYARVRDLATEGALGARLGARQLPAHDVRNKMDRIYLSELLEEQGPPGPAC